MTQAPENLHMARVMAKRSQPEKSKPFNALEALDQARMKKTQETKSANKKNRNLENIYFFRPGDHLKNDFSIKTGIDLSIEFSNESFGHENIINKIERKVKDLSQFYSFDITNTNQPNDVATSFFNNLQFSNKEYFRNKNQIEWYKCANDAFQKFGKQKAGSFYIRTNTFVAVFRKERGTGANICQVTPSPALNQAILDAQDQIGLKFEVEKIQEDTVDEEENESKNKYIKQADEEDEEPLDLEEIMNNMKEPLNMESKSQVMNENYFTIRMKDSYRLYTMKHKHVQTIFNLMINFVGQKLNQRTRTIEAQILAGYPFKGCTYNEGHLVSKTIEQASAKYDSSRLQMKIAGVFLHSQVQEVLDNICLETQNLKITSTESCATLSLTSEMQSTLLNIKDVVTKIRCTQK